MRRDLLRANADADDQLAQLGRGEDMRFGQQTQVDTEPDIRVRGAFKMENIAKSGPTASLPDPKPKPDEVSIG